MEVTAVILAGGRGLRMGGVDKGLVSYQGQRLIDWAIQAIQPQVHPLMINANRNLATYQTLGFPVISDANDQFDGPLAGMQAALRHAKTEWVLTLPCDVPHLPSDLCQQLTAAVIANRADMAIAQSPNGPHPVFCLMHQSLQASLARFLSSGQRKVRAWQAQQASVWVDFADDHAFTNINHLMPDTTSPSPNA